MRKIVLTFGLISGGILAALTALMVPACMNGTIDFKYSELVGYAAMLLSFLAVFFGIRSYREQHGGSITFGKAFQVGILITLVSCFMYVAGWEIVYWNFLPDFGEKYAALSTQRMRDHGASAAEIAEHTRRMVQFQKLYRNPLYNVGITFLEVFPLGLIVTLVSAAILRRKPDTPSPAAAVAA